MTDIPSCPRCGAALPPNAPAGLCPRCLMAAGLATESQPTAPSPTTDSGFEPPSPATLAGRFPQLEVMELIGHGGMGAVYKARQTNLDRMVALKIIRPEITLDPQFAERFSREARALARLSHQHILAVHDFGEVPYAEQEGQPSRPLYYFIMEYVDGANLRQLMRSGELTPEQAIAIVPPICDALQYAHDEGVVHRDIKPENILLDKRGRVKIADFGLAKLTSQREAEATLTGTHQVMGTPRYMAPEQLEGSHSVDHRADIYSLGVVFYEMLTGQAPLGHFEPPSAKVAIDVRLDEVVLRSLAREPQRRYQQASQVKNDVESISSSPPLRREPVVPRQTGNHDDEVDRQKELAEIAPDWLVYPVMGLFAAGWILVGLLWNLHWPGLVLAIGMMGAFTHKVVQWQLHYLPRLQQELDREPRWSRHPARVVAALLFVLGMLSAMAVQASVGDILSDMQLFGHPSNLWSLTQDEQRTAIAQSDLTQLQETNIVPQEFSSRFLISPLMLYVLWAPLFLFLSVASLLHTRRYRYTWKHWWRPSLSTTIYLLGMLFVVHFLHLVITGYSAGQLEAREIRCATSGDLVCEVLDRWQQEYGYIRQGQVSSSLTKEDETRGTLDSRYLVARSWFDGYQASWPYVVLRPHPPLHITTLTQHAPATTYVRIEFPHAMKGSPEEDWWTALVDELEQDLRACETNGSTTKE